jgi:hypothetical protein
VDLIFSDAPFVNEALSVWSDLSALADRVLKPGGLCLTYTGQAFLPQIHQALGQHLEYLWECSIRHTGGNRLFRKYHIFNTWQPMVVYGKPPLKVWWSYFSDMVSGGKEKELHEWQKAEAEGKYYIEVLCPVNGVVLDPFMGSGTTGVAAVELGRNFIGIEIDPVAFASAKERIEQIKNGNGNRDLARD